LRLRSGVFFSDVYSIARHNLSSPRLIPLIALEIAPRFRETRESADRTPAVASLSETCVENGELRIRTNVAHVSLSEKRKEERKREKETERRRRGGRVKCHAGRGGRAELVHQGAGGRVRNARENGVTPPLPLYNCMPDSDCISRALLAPFAPSLSRSLLPRSILAYREDICELPTPATTRHASPETWRKKGYCATPPSFLVRGCPSSPSRPRRPSRFHLDPPSTRIRKRRRTRYITRRACGNIFQA